MNIDESRLIAYLLGELKDTGQCREMEAELQSDPDLRALADEFRVLENDLEIAYRSEPGQSIALPSFTDIATQRIKNLGDASSTVFWLPWLSGIAASLALATILLLLNSQVDPQNAAQLGLVNLIPSDQFVQATDRSELLTPIWESKQKFPSSIRREDRDSLQIPTDKSSFARQISEPGLWNGDHSFAASEWGFTDVFANPVSLLPTEVSLLPYTQLEVSLKRGEFPLAQDIHIEAMVNAIPYEYKPAESLEEPFAVHLEQAISPWINGHTLLRVGLQGYEIPWEERPDCNLVFLIDVSGSMDERGKLPLIRKGIQKLVTKLRPHERIAVVTYGGASEVLLKSTLASRRSLINEMLDRLKPGGNTLAHAGIVEAYRIAAGAFLEGGNNQIIVCTDGDFSLGTSDFKTLRRQVAGQASRGIQLSTYGFGMDRGKSPRMETLAAVGNGHFAYVDAPAELDRHFVGPVIGSTIIIARDVKLEVEFNPSQIDAYRLIGWDDREQPEAPSVRRTEALRGASQSSGYSMTALYELIPSELTADPKASGSSIVSASHGNLSDEAEEPVTVRVYYQNVTDGSSDVLEVSLVEDATSFEEASSDFRFAAAMAGFGQLLRNSRYKGDVSFDWVLSTAHSALGHNRGGYRTSFLEMVRQAETITNHDISATEE